MTKVHLGRLIIVWLVLIGLLAFFGDVSVAASNAGRAAANFLTVPVGARPAALGGAYVAISDDNLAAWYNPAGLVSSDYSEVSFGHVQWFQDVTMHHGGAAFRLGDNTALAANILYVDYGKIDGYDINGAATGELQASDLAAAFSISQRVGDYFSIGVTGKYVGQRLAEISSSAYAGDIGLRADFGTVTVGATLANLGTTIRFEQVEEKLPTSVRAGVGVRFLEESLLLTAEYENQVYGNSVIHNGAEFNLDQRYFLRAGYFTSPESDSYIGSGLSFGAGALLGSIKLDYAYSGSESVGSADLHRFSVSYLIPR